MSLSRRTVVVLAGALPLIVARRSDAHNGVIHGTLHEVEIRGMAFNPTTLNVAVGDGIRWTNRDLVPHSATAEDKSWDTGRIAKDASAVVEIVEGMTGGYRCLFHPQMKAEFAVV